ncbi:hypothetical protein EZS27_011234 [termite gut metagenome]|uniref:Uncharacterized protein n=1 Tax=termite gut metagenome TaxID=433724 RepID=A0A5J4S4D1_9ZZZZ
MDLNENIITDWYDNIKTFDENHVKVTLYDKYGDEKKPILNRTHCFQMV